MSLLHRPITITRENGAAGQGLLRAFRVREYAELLPRLLDEPHLIERALDVAPGSLVAGDNPVTPESYEELARAFREVNAGFFAYCARQLGQMGSLPESLVASASAAGSPASRSPRA